jgi:hypothetical protein
MEEIKGWESWPGPASTAAWARPPRLRIGLWEFLPKNGGYETFFMEMGPFSYGSSWLWIV